jgi:uncharacterized protein YcbK (DUF882 family)
LLVRFLEGVSILPVEEARSRRGVARAFVAVTAAALLASCSTADTDVPFGFAGLGLEPETGASSDFDAPTVNSAASQQGVVGEFIVEEGDPQLPEQVASAPVRRPGSEAEVAVQAQMQPQAVAAEAVDPAASQPAAPDATVVAAVTETQVQPVTGQAAAQADGAAAGEAAAPQPTRFAENAPPQAASAPAPRKRGFLSSFFGVQSARAAPQATQRLIDVDTTPTGDEATGREEARPLVQLASAGESAKPLIDPAEFSDEGGLPGVRKDGLFEISRRSGLDDDSDIDLHEGEDLYQVASAAGLARLAPNGLVTQTSKVDVGCLKPSLVRVLKAVERHYGRNVIVTSGYRDPDRNRRARGARNSLHMYCAAADVQVEGVGKWELAKFVRSMPGRGGVGTYCHTNSVHVDVGPERDWNWRCRRRK